MGKTGGAKRSNQGTLGLELFETVSQDTKISQDTRVDNAFSPITSKGVNTLYMPPQTTEAEAAIADKSADNEHKDSTLSLDTSSSASSSLPESSKTPSSVQAFANVKSSAQGTATISAEAATPDKKTSLSTSTASNVKGSHTPPSQTNEDQFPVSKIPVSKIPVSQTPVSKIQEYDPFEPLAARMRPRNIDEYIGQSHLLGPDKPLRKALESGRCQSMILWGPPGVGKTTLALMLAKATGAVLEQISAVVCGMADIREAVARAKERRRHGVRTILFVDEVHRFNKLQQDAFLPHVEDGTIIFVGATTENPSFQVNSALLSRARVFVLKKLTEEELEQLLDLTLNSERGLKSERLVMDERVRKALIGLADGDARHLLTTLEMLVDDAATLKDGSKQITYAMVGAIAGRRLLSYDKNGDAYYDLISAFHKSVRGSAPDAALYWYARILEAGGDPSYVARRILAIATEDVGLADPNAMQIALNAWDIFNRVGSAEGERAIAEAAVYMALAPKSNHLYAAFNQVRKDVVTLPSFDVPLYIRNAPTKLMSELGYHAGYRYAHDFPGAYAPGECFMPEELHGRRYYYPSERGFELYLKSKQEYLFQRDIRATQEEQRFKPAHAQQMQINLKHRYPELCENDLAALAQADAEPQGLGPQISPQFIAWPQSQISTNSNQAHVQVQNQTQNQAQANLAQMQSPVYKDNAYSANNFREQNSSEQAVQGFFQREPNDSVSRDFNIGQNPNVAPSSFDSQQAQLGQLGQQGPLGPAMPSAYGQYGIDRSSKQGFYGQVMQGQQVSSQGSQDLPSQHAQHGQEIQAQYAPQFNGSGHFNYVQGQGSFAGAAVFNQGNQGNQGGQAYTPYKATALGNNQCFHGEHGQYGPARGDNTALQGMQNLQPTGSDQTQGQSSASLRGYSAHGIGSMSPAQGQGGFLHGPSWQGGQMQGMEHSQGQSLSTNQGFVQSSWPQGPNQGGSSNNSNYATSPNMQGHASVQSSYNSQGASGYGVNVSNSNDSNLNGHDSGNNDGSNNSGINGSSNSPSHNYWPSSKQSDYGGDGGNDGGGNNDVPF